MQTININKNLSIHRINADSCVVCVDSEFKLITCDIDILEEFLNKAEGKTQKDVIKLFSERFSENDIVNFTEILLRENIIYKEKSIVTNHEKKISVIYKGNLYENIKNKLFGIVEEIHLVNYSNNKLLGDVILVILDGVSYKEMLELNRRLYREGRPYFFIYYNGMGVACGPFVIPNRTACFECLMNHRIKQLKNNIYGELTVNDLLNLRVSNLLSEESFENSFYWSIARAVQCELRKVDKEGEIYGFVNKELIFTNGKSHYDSKREFVPISSCNCCNAHNNNYTYLKNGKMFEEFSSDIAPSKLEIKYTAGGFRSLSSEETKSIVDTALRESGLKIRIELVEENPFKDIIPVYDSQLDSSHVNSSSYLLYSQWSHGKGLTKEQAYFSAAFEIFERISARYFGEKSIISAKYKDVKGCAINLAKITENILNIDTEFEQLTDESDIDWVTGFSLSSNKPILIPASMVFLSSTCFKGDFFPTSSSGLAAGGTLEDAILQGMYELIEHDAWMIGQANPVKLPIIDIRSSTNEILKQKIQLIENLGYQIIVRDYTGDFGLPVFRTWIVSPNNYTSYAFNGLGASYSPEVALERSVTEAVQSANGSKFVKKQSYKKPSAGYMMKDPNSIYNLNYFIKKDIKITENDKYISLDKYRAPAMNSVEDVLSFTLKKLKKVDPMIDLVYVDLTRKTLRIPVVRTLFTSSTQILASPLTVVSPRMYTFQKEMGYSQEQPKYEDLYMGIYPH